VRSNKRFPPYCCGLVTLTQELRKRIELQEQVLQSAGGDSSNRRGDIMQRMLGWSWGGFDLDEGNQVFVMNGFTYGGGVEKNFGWLRAFVQVKAINYGNVNLSNSNVSTSNEVETSGLSVRNFINTNSGGSRTTISADVVAVTGGITIPLWHP
jgi:hypothetical protein